METLQRHIFSTLIGSGAGFAWWCFVQLLIPASPVWLAMMAGALAANISVLFRTS